MSLMLEFIDIIVIISAIIFVGVIIGIFVYRKIKHIPTGECACCKNKGSNLMKMYRKKYKKQIGR